MTTFAVLPGGSNLCDSVVFSRDALHLPEPVGGDDDDAAPGGVGALGLRPAGRASDARSPVETLEPRSRRVDPARVLEPFERPPVPVTVLYPPNRSPSARVRAVVECLVKGLTPVLATQSPETFAE